MSLSIIKKMFIDFICENKKIMSCREIGKLLQFIFRKNFTGWICGGVNNDTFGFRRDHTLQIGHQKRPVGWRHPDVNRDRSRGYKGTDVVTVKRFEDNDLITGI